MKKHLYFIQCFLLAIGTSAALLIDLSKKKVLAIPTTNNHVFVCFIVGIFFLWFYHKFISNTSRQKPFQILSGFLSFLLTFGYSYDVSGSASLVFGNIGLILFSIVKLVCFYYMFNTGISLLYERIVSSNIKTSKPVTRLGVLFDKHPFLFCFIAIVICYLPYFIAYYPGVMCNDPLDQVSEVMGLTTKHTNAGSIVYRDPTVTITNLNPIIHTLLLGGCYKLGYNIGNENLGVLLYVIIQSAIMISILAYSICYMKKEGVSTKLLYITLGIFAFVPVFPFYAISTVKDTLFSVFVLLYIIKLYDMLKHDYTINKYVTLVLISILIILFRNNGLYTILLSLPFMLIWVKDKRKQIAISLVVILAFNFGFFNVLLPNLGITSTSVREALSIPFQQTARLAKYHGDKIAEEDRKVINQVLDYETLGERYNPVLSDPVKDKYNPNATNEDLMEYFKVWFKYLPKYPVVYIDATIGNIYGFFYPNTSKWYIYYVRIARLDNPEFNYDYKYRYIDELKPVRTVLEGFGTKYPYIPVIGLLVNIGFVVWTYFAMLAMLLVNKKREYISILLPAFSLILVCVAGPANTYFRYAQPFVFTLPVIMFLLYNVLNKKHKEK